MGKTERDPRSAHWDGAGSSQRIRGAVVLEDGAVAFDPGRVKYSISGEYHKCLLHLWSAERNTVGRCVWRCSDWGRRVNQARDWPRARPALAYRQKASRQR